MGESGGDTVRNRIVLSLLALCIVAVPTGVWAEEADGGYAGSFLQVPIGARPTGMGGAYRAVSDDGAGILFNPAGMTSISKPLFSSAYRAMKLDRKLGYVGAFFPVKGEAAVGLQWLHAGSGSVPARDADGALLGHELYQNNNVFSLLFAKRFENYIAVGADISYLDSRMTEISANSVGFDFGAMLYLDEFVDREKRLEMPVQAMQIGLAVKNVQKMYKWNSEEYNYKYTTDGLGVEQQDKFPVEIGLGASARFLKRQLLLAVDFVNNAKQGPEFHAGAEMTIQHDFMLRAGYDNTRLTAGFGYLFRLDQGKHTFGLDYAFSTDKSEEGAEHIFSFDILW